MPTTTTLTTLALARAAQPPTGTCPANLQAILLWVALRRVEQALLENETRTLAQFAVLVLATAPGHMSQNKTLITPTTDDSCGPVA